MTLRARRMLLGVVLTALPVVVAEIHRQRDLEGSTFAYLATNGVAVVGLWMFLLAMIGGERRGASLSEVLIGFAKAPGRAVRAWVTEGVDQPWSIGEAIGVAMQSFVKRPLVTAGFTLLYLTALGLSSGSAALATRMSPALGARLLQLVGIAGPLGPGLSTLAAQPVPASASVVFVGGAIAGTVMLCVAQLVLAEGALAAVRSEPMASGAIGRALRRTPHYLGYQLVLVLLLAPIIALGVLNKAAPALMGEVVAYLAFSGVTVMLAMLAALLVVATRLLYAPLFIVDEGAPFWTAIAKSWRATGGFAVGLFILVLATLPVSLLGAGTGVFAAIAMPFVTLAVAFTYVRATGRNEIPWFPADFATKSIRLYLGVTFLALLGLFGGLFAWVRALPAARGMAWSGKDAAIRVGAIVTGVGAVVVALALVLPFLLDALERRRFSSFVAARHVRSPKSGFLTIISILSICGVAMSSCSLVSVVSVMGGFSADLKRKILGNNAHIVVDTTAATPFADHEAVLERVRSVPGVTGAAAVVHGEVMASSASNIAGVIVSGVQPADIINVNELALAKGLEVGKLDYLAHPEKLTRLPPDEPIGIGPGGERYYKQAELPPLADDIDESVRKVILDRPDRPGIILGRELAKTLHVYVGDELTLVSPLGDLGPMGILPRTKKFRVAGIFYSEMYEYDATYVYTMLDVAQDYFQTGAKASSIEIKVDEAERAETIAPLVEQAIARPDLRVRDWREINKSLFGALRLERVATFVILTIAIIVASFCIVCTLLLMVTEKGKEIAIMKAIGASDGAILRIFMIEGVLIGGIGTVFGVTTGFALCYGLAKLGLPLDPEVYYIDKLPVTVNGWDFAAVALAAMTVTTLATLFPAYAASRVRPVDGLRYE